MSCLVALKTFTFIFKPKNVKSNFNSDHFSFRPYWTDCSDLWLMSYMLQPTSYIIYYLQHLQLHIHGVSCIFIDLFARNSKLCVHRTLQKLFLALGNYLPTFNSIKSKIASSAACCVYSMWKRENVISFQTVSFILLWLLVWIYIYFL